MLTKNYSAFQTLGECPVWNWFRVTEEQDLRYLLRLKSYEKLPRFTKSRQDYLQAIYKELLLQFENLNSPVLKAKAKVMVRIIDLVLETVKTGKDPDKLKKASLIFRGLMLAQDPNLDWLYDVDFTDNISQKRLIPFLAVELKKLEERKAQGKGRKPVSLDKQLVRLESVLGININRRKTSVAMFLEYQKEAVQKINLTNKALS
jgi:hypothetical protein